MHITGALADLGLDWRKEIHPGVGARAETFFFRGFIHKGVVLSKVYSVVEIMCVALSTTCRGVKTNLLRWWTKSVGMRKL